ncbi:MAG: OprD family outer membrane porin [Chitinophagaceae bacterium]
MMRIFFSVFFCFVFGFSASSQQSTPLVAQDSSAWKKAVHESKFYINLRFNHIETYNQDSLTDYYATALTSTLKFESGSFKGFRFAAGGQYSADIGSSDLNSPDKSTGSVSRYEISLFDLEDRNNRNRLYRLDQLYLNYSWKNNTITAGRQLLNTPLLNPQDGFTRPSAVEAIWMNVEASEKITFQGGYVSKVSPRGTVKFHTVAESIGMYGVGFNLDGTKSGYKYNVHSNGLYVAGLRYTRNEKSTTQLWNYFIDKVANTIYFQTDHEYEYANDMFSVLGLIIVHQNKISNGGNDDQDKTYFAPNTSNLISGRIGIGKGMDRFHLNISQVLGNSRYLFPREWGKEPFYTSMKRERIEGAGNLSAYTVNYIHNDEEHRWRTEWAYGYFHLPDVKNTVINKYMFPSFHQFAADVTYAFAGKLKNMDMGLTYTYKKNAAPFEGNKYIINRVNMHHINFVLNYHL